MRVDWWYGIVGERDPLLRRKCDANLLEMELNGLCADALASADQDAEDEPDDSMNKGTRGE